MFQHTALKYIARNLSVFPATSAKKPAIPAWVSYQTRVPSAEEIEAWSRDLGDMNIAIACGRLSNLTVVDCDTPQAIQEVEGLLPEGMELPIVTTPRGRHYYFRYCPKLHSRNRAHGGIDVKSEGGYVLAPPSKTESGVYTWNSEMNLDTIPERPPVPDALLALLKAGTTSPAIPSLDKPILTQGTRDQDLFHIAYQLFKDGRPRNEVERIIVNMAKICTPHFPEKEALIKIKSAFDRIQRTGTATGNSSATPKTNLVRMSEVQKVPLEWLWPKRFPLGMLSIVAGKQGQGKSTLMIHIACRLSKAEPWPDAPGPVAPITTLLITCEDPREQIIKYRIEANGGNDYFIKHFDSVFVDDIEQPFDLTTNLDRLEAHLAEDPNIKLVIIDPLASHMGGKLDSSNPFQTRWHLSPLARLAKKYNVAIVGIAHFKKGEDVLDALDKIAGSYQFTSLPRAVWVVMEDKEDPAEKKRHCLLPGKINIVPTPTGLSFRIETVLIDGQETGKIVFEDEINHTTANELLEKNARTRTSTRKEIEAFIVETLMNGPLLVKPSPELGAGESLEAALTTRGYSLAYADKVKTELKREGKVRYGRKEENGRWWIYTPEVPGPFGRRPR